MNRTELKERINYLAAEIEDATEQLARIVSEISHEILEDAEQIVGFLEEIESRIDTAIGCLDVAMITASELRGDVEDALAES